MDDSGLDIGTRIKERREELGYSLEQVSERIRIRKVYLESIEKNNFSDLPGKAYVAGFIDVYCRFLGLDSKKILASLTPAEEPKTGNVGPTPLAQKVENQFEPITTGQRQARFLWPVLVFFVVGLVYLLVPVNYDDEAPTEIQSPVLNTVSTQVEDEVVEDKESEISVNEVTQSQEVEKGRNPAASQAPAVDISANEPLPSISPKGSSLRMVALENGSLIINVDKRQPFQYKLHDGLDLTWKIVSEASVKMDQAGVARFWLDGQELDVSDQAEFFLQSDQKDNVQ